jgi:hypothetical protein
LPSFDDDSAASVEDSVGAGEEAECAAEDVAPGFAAAGVGGEDGGGLVIGVPLQASAGHVLLR